MFPTRMTNAPPPLLLSYSISRIYLMWPPAISTSDSSEPDAVLPLISISPPILHLVLLPSPATMLNYPHLKAVLVVVPARRYSEVNANTSNYAREYGGYGGI